MHNFLIAPPQPPRSSGCNLNSLHDSGQVSGSGRLGNYSERLSRLIECEHIEIGSNQPGAEEHSIAGSDGGTENWVSILHGSCR
jgi:hypothetical protein